VHNLNPHEQAYPRLSQIANRVLFALADAVHVHDAEALASVARNYGRRNGVYVIPHGSYVGVYANSCTRHEARKRLGLADHAFVYLFLGQVRRYKGIEDLVDAFDQVADQTNCLVIAGNPHDAQYGAELVEHIGQPHQREDETLPRPTDGETLRPEIRTWLQYVPDSELQYFMRASDVVVLPYRDMTTSGAAILAFSFGVPIIAPARVGFLELAADGRGITYDPEAADGLVRALQRARNQDMAESGRKALDWAKEHQWGSVVRRFVEMYADITRPGK
jgi:glycosyltransferase involved in cell wall biosynthesis